MNSNIETMSAKAATKLADIYDAERRQGTLFDAAEIFPKSDFAFNQNRLGRLAIEYPGQVVLSDDELDDWRYTAQCLGAGFGIDAHIESPNNLWMNVLNQDGSNTKGVTYVFSHAAFVMTRAAFVDNLKNNYVEGYYDRLIGREYFGMHDEPIVFLNPSPVTVEDDDDTPYDFGYDWRGREITYDEDDFEDYLLTDTINDEQGEEL